MARELPSCIDDVIAWRKHNMRRWQPVDVQVAGTVMAIKMHSCEVDSTTWPDIMGTLQQVQEATRDKRSARERRRERVPTQTRELYRRAAESTDPEEWTALRNAAWHCIRQAHAVRLCAEHMQYLRAGGGSPRRGPL